MALSSVGPMGFRAAYLCEKQGAVAAEYRKTADRKKKVPKSYHDGIVPLTSKKSNDPIIEASKMTQMIPF